MTQELSFYERTGFHSFDEIHQTYHERIEKYVQRRVQNYSDVEDIVQKNFLVFFKRK